MHYNEETFRNFLKDLELERYREDFGHVKI